GEGRRFAWRLRGLHGELYTRVPEAQPPLSANLGDVFVGSSADTTFTVSNPTPQTASPASFYFNALVTGLDFSILSATMPMAGDCAGLPWASGASSTIRIRFPPRGPADRIPSLFVPQPYVNVGDPSIPGRGVRPATLTAATRHNFG